MQHWVKTKRNDGAINDTGEPHLHVTSLRTELAPLVQKPQIESLLLIYKIPYKDYLTI